MRTLISLYIGRRASVYIRWLRNISSHEGVIFDVTVYSPIVEHLVLWVILQELLYTEIFVRIFIAFVKSCMGLIILSDLQLWIPTMLFFRNTEAIFSPLRISDS